MCMLDRLSITLEVGQGGGHWVQLTDTLFSYPGYRKFVT
jgi:hypothetical protein